MSEHPDPRPSPDFSAVLPVCNEEGSLRELHRRLSEVLGELGSFEIVFVDDGSTDDSWTIISELARDDENVLGLRFSRNFGHHLALTAGLDVARGSYVVTLDADLQDQPEDIPKLYRTLQEGYDVVYGVHTPRRHSLVKRITSRLFVWLVNRLSDTPATVNTHVYRIMNRRFVAAFRQLRERDRFVTGLYAWLGFRQAGTAVGHAPRPVGASKYGVRKMTRLALDAIASLSGAPLRVSLLCALVLTVAAIAYGAYLVATACGGGSIEGWSTVLLVVLGVAALQLYCAAVRDAYLRRTYTQVQGRPLYVIQETTPRLDKARLPERAEGSG